MATETRKVSQYKYFELIEVRKTRKNNQGNLIEDHTPVAIFDDQAKLNAFTSTSRYAGGSFSWYSRDEWTSTKPAPENFGLPFNPEPAKEEASA